MLRLAAMSFWNEGLLRGPAVEPLKPKGVHARRGHAGGDHLPRQCLAPALHTGIDQAFDFFGSVHFLTGVYGLFEHPVWNCLES